MLSPKKTNYRKYRKGMIRGVECRATSLAYGVYGLQALESGRITAKQLETIRLSVVRKLKKLGNVWFRIFPDIPVTSKPTEVRMGKGKGAVDYWCARVRAGRVLIELDGISVEFASEILHTVSAKLPISTRFVSLV